MAISFLLSILVFSISLPPSLSASNELPKSGYITLPIKTDPTTHQYYTSIGIGSPRHNTNLAIDLSGNSLWYDCGTHYNSSTYTPVPCNSQNCPQNSPCIACNNFPTKPGCTNNTCGLDIINPFADTIFSGDLGEDLLYIPGLKVPGRFLSGCTDSDRFTTPVLVGLARGIRGVLGLAKGHEALPNQMSSKYNIIPKFTLCLPSSKGSGIGKIFIGPFSSNSVSSRIPLPFSPSGSDNEYYISVNSINIDGKTVNFTNSLLSVNGQGNGGTKMSTMAPYTVLHHSIYKPFVREFVKKAAERKIKRVRPVAPFGACFDAKTVGGNDVPGVDLVLDNQGRVRYGINGHNSMVEVKKGVKCLAFVDGGKEAKAGIVLGGKQMEDRILEFDLSRSVLSFSDSLLLHGASCSDPASLKF